MLDAIIRKTFKKVFVSVILISIAKELNEWAKK